MTTFLFWTWRPKFEPRMFFVFFKCSVVLSMLKINGKDQITWPLTALELTYYVSDIHYNAPPPSHSDQPPSLLKTLALTWSIILLKFNNSGFIWSNLSEFHLCFQHFTITRCGTLICQLSLYWLSSTIAWLLNEPKCCLSFAAVIRDELESNYRGIRKYNRILLLLLNTRLSVF